MTKKSNTKLDGLPEGWTRWTVIVREDLLDRFKDYAWTDRRTHKEVMEQMMNEFLADKEILRRK
jgi:hypothetical protein